MAPPVLAVSGSACAGPWAFTAALKVGGAVQVEHPEPGARADLAVLVDRLLRRCGAALREVGELRLDVGPGSYVGLRSAVTFARVLARLRSLRLLTATSLELMAAAALPLPAGTMLRPVLDARRGRLHSQLLRVGHGHLEGLAGPAALPPDALLAQVRPGERLLCASALHGALAEAQALGATLAEAPPVDAGLLFAAVLPLQEVQPHQVEPLYLMGSYAED
jgi:tRNA threonylcarbamoyladenosine biosynthesis protein TsaB